MKAELRIGGLDTPHLKRQEENRALQFGHSINFVVPLIGIVGTTKKSVIKRIPVFSVNCASVPQFVQRIVSGVLVEPQVMNFVPMTKNIILLRFYLKPRKFHKEVFDFRRCFKANDFFGVLKLL